MSSSDLPPGPINPYGAPQAPISARHDLESHGFKDRKGGLIAFGIIEIILGIGCFAIVGLMAVMLLAASATSDEVPVWRTIIPALLLYGFFAVAFVWLGIGSIRARRWARNLVLIGAWISLVTGIFMTIAFLILLPRVLANIAPDGNSLPPEGQFAVLIVSAAFMAVLFIIVPAIFVIFYRSRHVKATCEVYDPTPGWTDACPLPVLALSMFLVLGSLTMLTPPFVANGVMMFFGTIVSGLTGSMLYWALAALWLYAAWAVYRIQLAGWWTTLVSYFLFCTSFVFTVLRIDPIEMYARMGYTEEQLEAIRQLNSFTGPNFALWFTVMYLPLFAYLIYVKKFFK